jgi:hypothetical protein
MLDPCACPPAVVPAPSLAARALKWADVRYAVMDPCGVQCLQALAASATTLSILHGASSAFVPEDATVYKTEETRELAAKYPPATFPWYKKLTANHGPQQVLFTARVGGNVIHHRATCELIRSVLESLPSMGECGLHSVSAPVHRFALACWSSDALAIILLPTTNLSRLRHHPCACSKPFHAHIGYPSCHGSEVFVDEPFDTEGSSDPR